MIKNTTTIAEKSLFLTAIALFAVVIAVVIDIPDIMFIGILLIAFILLAIAVPLLEKEYGISEKNEDKIKNEKIQNLQDIADIINNDVDNGTEEIKEYLRSLDRDKLERLALKMAILTSIVPEFLEQHKKG